MRPGRCVQNANHVVERGEAEEVDFEFRFVSLLFLVFGRVVFLFRRTERIPAQKKDTETAKTIPSSDIEQL